MKRYTGIIVDVLEKRMYYGHLDCDAKGAIHAKTHLSDTPPPGQDLPYILPGFVDAHIHIESSMLTPYEFGRLALRYGTVATVSDPHEIANVCGVAGVEYMITLSEQTPLKIHYGAPSCVPATTFETAGARIDAAAVISLLARPDIFYLSEMMNYPGVLHRDHEVMAKIHAAHMVGKPVDGHAPGLRGADAASYVSAGIHTDHECYTHEEALEKLKLGMLIQIREGSAARNFEALAPLLSEWSSRMMFCSDDKHPDHFQYGHINKLAARAVQKGVPLMRVLEAACINPVLHYKLPVGILRIGDPADFVMVKDLVEFEVIETYINGDCVAKNGSTTSTKKRHHIINTFNALPLKATQLAFSRSSSTSKVRVIEAHDGQLITSELVYTPPSDALMVTSDVAADVLKIVVVNRYTDAPPAIAFIKNFGLKRGALASSVAHDSHNVVAVGVNDADIASVLNAVISSKGGLAVTDGAQVDLLPLPIAGLMSDQPAEQVVRQYILLDAKAKFLGCTLKAPFMTLAFMALLVIPQLKLSDKGLFDGKLFGFVDREIA